MKKMLLSLVITGMAMHAFSQANTALSNLSSTAINQSLFPGTDNSTNLGSSSKSWKDIYVDGSLYLDGQKFLSDGTSSTAGNTFAGMQAGNSTTGTSNTFTGYHAGYSNTSGNYNSANGYSSLASSTTGNSNAAFGYKTLTSTTSGYENTAVGANALRLNTVGHGNVAQGLDCLYSNTTGTYSTASGYNALHDNISDDYNTAVGAFAGDLSANSDWSSFFGYYAGCSFASAGMDHSTAIGYNSKVTGPDQVKIGNSSTGSIGGYADWTDFSDGRYKKDVKEEVRGLDFINKLRPVTYHLDVTGLRLRLNETNSSKDGLTEEEQKSIEKKEAVLYSGFIAQEVEKAAQELGYDFSGVDAPETENSLYGLRYAQFVVPLVKAVQELDAKDMDQLNQLAEVKMENEKLKSENSHLQHQIDELRLQVNQLLRSPAYSNMGTEKTVGSNEVKSSSLGQNIPNPFDRTTVIPVHLPLGCNHASILITDANARIIKLIPIASSDNQIQVNAQTLGLSPTGSYSYSLIIDGRTVETKQMTLIK